MDKVDVTIESYDNTALDYSKKVEDLPPLEDILFFRDLVRAEAKVLDLGCGSGRDVKIFRELGLNVYGIDLSENLLSIAAKKSPKAVFKKMDFRNLDFKDNTFHGVWASASLLHIPRNQIEDCLRGIKRVLKEKGYFYAALKQGEGEEFKADNRFNGGFKYWTYYLEEEFRSLLEGIGFSIIKTDSSNVDKLYRSHPFISIFAELN